MCYKPTTAFDGSIASGKMPLAKPKMECQNNCERCKKKYKHKSRGVKKIVSLLTGLFLSLSVYAQETVQKNFWDDPFNHPMMPLYALCAGIILLTILALVVVVYTIKVLNVFTLQLERERYEKLGKAYVPQPSWWTRFMEQLNASVPVEKETDIDMGHSYDGIRELDNHLPPWWKWLFYGTIGWALVYLFVYHLSDTLPLQEKEYQDEVALATEQIEKFKASQPQAAIDENSLVFSNDAVIIEKGKNVFMSNNCGACHRNDGGGNTIGPNITDDYWLHGGGIKNIFTTIKNGVVEKGMPAWGKSMSPQDVRDVTFFVMSLHSTNPANAKAPQGELFKEEAVVFDSTKVQASL